MARYYQVPSLAADLRDSRPHSPKLAVEHGRGHRPIACAITAAALRRIGVDEHGHGRHAVSPGKLQVAAAPRRVKAQRVHHRGQAAAEPGRHYLVEQGEGVRRCVQVVLAAADEERSRSDETTSSGR